MSRLALAAALALLTTPTFAADFNPSDLLTFTAQDIQAADADASQPTIALDACGTHMKDCIAHQCYAGVMSFFASGSGDAAALPPAPVGVISAFQSARDLVKGSGTLASQGLLPQPIVVACGALYLDARNDALRVAAQAGGTGLTLFGLHL